MTPSAKRWASGLAIAAALAVSVQAGRKQFQAPIADPQGRLLIIEYSDYQCPHCKAAQPVVKELLSHYGDKVHWVHKNFPLDMVHTEARPAAIAAVCAQRQGKFEAYNDLLFDRQDGWSTAKDPSPYFDEYAKETGLDVSKFDACRQDPTADQSVKADQKDGMDLGVTSTPTFFIDNQRMVGGPQLQWKGPRLIDKWLAKK